MERGANGYPGLGSPSHRRSSAGNSTSRLDSPGASRPAELENKRRKVASLACLSCRRRKSKCDGARPACAACSQVYHSQCIYDPSSDQRRKGVYKKPPDDLKTRASTLQTIIHAILNYPEAEALALVSEIRACESLDKVAESVVARENGESPDEEVQEALPEQTSPDDDTLFESQLASKVGELRLDGDSVRLIGGTSNLLFFDQEPTNVEQLHQEDDEPQGQDPALSWTTVITDAALIRHLLNFYFTWHYTFFTILSRFAFERDFNRGRFVTSRSGTTQHCSPILVNAMLALGCHFAACPGARADPNDSATTGDHFFKEAKKLIYENDLLATPRLSTVQALALMSVREAGCGRENQGWVWSGMAFRMASDLGLSFKASPTTLAKNDPHPILDDVEEDARKITFWGMYMIDKCWSNYLGRLPLFLTGSNVTSSKFDVFPVEEAESWSPYTEAGFSLADSQPSRLRTVALQISALCEISSDLLNYFYHPEQVDKPLSKQVEMKRLGEIHGRLEDWKRRLPKELEPKEGTLASVMVMHMFFQVLYIHLFRPFLKYNVATSPLPVSVSPRKLCTQAAGQISKLLRLYKRSHSLRQIVNIAVYIAHTACTIHLLNLPEKTAKRDIVHGVKALEDIAEGWICARRTLTVLHTQARKWHITLPEEAADVFARSDQRFGSPHSSNSSSPKDIRSAVHQDVKLPTKTNNSLSHALRFQQPQSSQVYPKEAYRQSHNTSLDPTPLSTQLHSPPGPKNNVMSFNAPQWHSNEGVPQMIPQAGVSLTSQPVNNRDISHLSMDSWNPPPDQIQTQSHQPTSARPRQQSSSRKRPREPVPSADMFGGVQALLREGEDSWIFQDQSQLASDFSNWKYSSPENSSAWQRQYHAQSDAPVQSREQRSSVSAGMYGEGAHEGVGQFQAYANHALPLGAMQGGQQPVTGADAGFGNYLTYNESEWYQ